MVLKIENLLSFEFFMYLYNCADIAIKFTFKDSLIFYIYIKSIILNAFMHIQEFLKSYFLNFYYCLLIFTFNTFYFLNFYQGLRLWVIFKKNLHVLTSATVKISLFYDQNSLSFDSLDFINFRNLLNFLNYDIRFFLNFW